MPVAKARWEFGGRELSYAALRREVPGPATRRSHLDLRTPSNQAPVQAAREGPGGFP